MFQFVFLALARVCLNLLYVTEVQDHGETLTVCFNDNREPLTVTGADVETLKAAVRPPKLAFAELRTCGCRDSEDADTADEDPPDDGDHAGDQEAEADEEMENGE